MRFSQRWVPVAFGLGIGACACQPEPTAPRRSQLPVAVVNGEPITLSEFNLRVQRSWTQTAAGAEVPMEIKLYYLEGQIEERLVAQEAERVGLSVSEAELEQAFRTIRSEYSDPDFAQLLIDEYIDLEEWKAGLRRQLLIQKITDLALNDRIEVSSDQVADYYRKHVEEFAQPVQVHARQAVLSSFEEAKAFQLRVQAGEDFSVLAQAQSRDPAVEQAGVLKWFSPGQMPRPVERALFSLPPGKVSDPIRTDYGFHVLQVLERREARTLTLAEVEPVIRRRLREAERERLYREWIRGIWARARIEINYSLF